MRSIAAAIIALSLSAAAGGTTDDGISDSQYLAYARGFAPYTAKLTALRDGKKREATAVLIADHWAITAAHVAAGVTGAVVAGRPIVEIVVHPDFDDDTLGHGDLALLRSDQSFGLDYYPSLATGTEKEGDVVSIAGYGITGRISTGYSLSDGRLRAGTNRIERFERSIIVCRISRGSSPMEFCISPGDSGGPLFCCGRLAGINSFTMADKGPLRSRAGEESCHTRVSLYRAWIEGVMK